MTAAAGRRGKRTQAERDAAPSVFYAGRWRSPEAVERKRACAERNYERARAGR